MNSEEIANFLRPLSRECFKKRIEYIYVNKNIKTMREFKTLLKLPFSIIPYKAFSHLFKTNYAFETRVPKDPIPEQTFTLLDIFDKVLVVGALGEIYHANINSKFKKIYKLDSKKLIIRYIPVPEVRRYVVVDTDIFTLILGGKKEGLTGFNSIVKIPTSWGASHICMIGDIIIIEKNGIYRVQKDVFELTYSNIFLK